MDSPQTLSFMKKIFWIAFSVLILLNVYSVLSQQNLDSKVILKEKLIRQKLLKKGYAPSYTIISGHRSEGFNKILPLSAKNSFHLYGKAIDFWLGDINQDGKTNTKDVDDFVQVVREVENENPQIIGGIGTYKGKFYSKMMVHIDVRGYRASWNY
jgi:uncharacterized protein YcbK (DUF882 family)